jgi:abortive infection bacteriophage resistance protein
MGSLDAKACARRFRRADRIDTSFHWWLDKYESLQGRAAKDPFVVHNLNKYGTPLAIWIACEFFDFGAVSNLYELMKYEDRSAIAEAAGLREERTLRSWLRSLNYIRNLCAHNARLWNRVLTVKPALRIDDLPAELAHLASVDNAKIYPIIAITAHLTNMLCPDTHWVAQAGQLLMSFPRIPSRRIEEIGAPVSWPRQRIWQKVLHEVPSVTTARRPFLTRDEVIAMPKADRRLLDDLAALGDEDTDYV